MNKKIVDNSEISFNHQTKTKDRLLGVDLFRAIAAYGVVLIHGLGRIERSELTINIVVSFFDMFSVPFFLTAAFFFSRNSLLSNDIKKFIVNRFERIMLPYFAWSCVYVLARFGGYLIGDRSSFEKLISDPMRLVFFGGASVQLYFLPMLFIGTLVALPLTRLIGKLNNNIILIILLFLLSFFNAETIAYTARSLILPEAIIIKDLVYISSSDHPLIYNIVRLILMNVRFIFKCLPYIAFSLLFQSKYFNDIFSKLINFLQKKRYEKIMPYLLFLFIIAPFILPILTNKIRISFIYYLSIPYLFFFYAIYISPIICQKKYLSFLINKLSYLSFGIYLSHALITQSFVPIAIKLYPNIINTRLSLGMSLIFALIIFLLSAALTYLLTLNKKLARVFLGL